MPLPPDADPDVSFDLSCGTVHLTRMKKHNRFTAIRRGGSFGWTLGPENALTDKIREHLETDIAGSVAAHLIGRASLTWELAPDVKILHEPDDVEALQRTPDLLDAAEEMAETFRAEVNEDSVTEEARERLDGPFLTRQAHAVQVGRKTKEHPNRPRQHFGRLAPLGVTNLERIIPYFGYLPVRAFSSWTSLQMVGYPRKDRPKFHIEHPQRGLWVKPSYGASDELTEVIAVTHDYPAAFEAPDSVPALQLACERLIVADELRVIFAPGLTIRVPDGPDEQVQFPATVEAKDLEDVLPRLTEDDQEYALASGWWTLVPYDPAEYIRHLPSDRHLRHGVIWITRRETHHPIDAWEHTTLKEEGIPDYGEDLVFYDFKPDSFTGVIADLLAEELPSEALEAESQELLTLRRVVGLLEQDLEPLLRERAADQESADNLLARAQALREGLEELVEQDAQVAASP